MQRGLDGLDGFRGRRFLALLGLHADHRHMAIRAETGVKDLGNRHVAQFQRAEGIAVSAHVDGLRAFGPQGRAAAEVDAKV